MITLVQYVGPHITSPDWTPARQAAAAKFLPAVNALLSEMEREGVKIPINPATGSQVSGKEFGGFRPQDCPQGAPDSSHKQGRGVDVFDPHNDLDKWLDQFEGQDGHNSKLFEYGLYREAPNATLGWLHLTDRAPHSGRNTFIP